jgi:hypothetical protein
VGSDKVINTKEWDKTHGFGDCIYADTNVQEFKILSLLAKKGGLLIEMAFLNPSTSTKKF